jgi:hypothetical protein
MLRHGPLTHTLEGSTPPFRRTAQGYLDAESKKVRYRHKVLTTELTRDGVDRVTATKRVVAGETLTTSTGYDTDNKSERVQWEKAEDGTYTVYTYDCPPHRNAPRSDLTNV